MSLCGAALCMDTCRHTVHTDGMTQKPADETYRSLSLRLVDFEREAGAMLAQSLRADCKNPATARKIAEDFAAQANEVGAEMRAWRLATGYEK